MEFNIWSTKWAFDMKAIIEWAKNLWLNLSGKKKWKNWEILAFWVKKESYLIMLGIFVVLLLTTLIFIGLAFYRNHALNQRLSQLEQLKNYQLNTFKNDELMADLKDELPTNFNEMLELYTTTKTTKERVEAELNFKKSVYSDFLRNFLLPSLNIWKDPYTQQIDLSILGKKYLQKNPYQDISLLSQWSSIIRESGKDIETNEVVNMQIWEIKEGGNWFFNIPISISFKSNSKRAFLLLVDKLSLTSNINNIWLLNDFTYHLFDTIREEKAEEIKNLIQTYGAKKSDAMDEKTFKNQIIAHYLYNFLESKSDEVNLLIDNALVDKVIKQSIVCGEKESSATCYFRFRDKYRTIPGLAYSIWVESTADKATLLKDFYASIPPLIAIQSFTFDKAKAQGFSLADDGEYLGNVSFNIYGRGISTEESTEISTLLKEACFGSGSSTDLTVQGALDKVNEKMKIIGASTDSSDGKVALLSNLLELKDSLTSQIEEFDKLSPYNQMIKKFEIYRELKNMSLCTQ